MTQPAFIPAGLISLRDLYEELDAEDLGGLLADGSIVGLYYLEATGFSQIPLQIWLGEHGRSIADAGEISSEIAAHQLGVWTRGQDLTVFINRPDLDPFFEPAAAATTSEVGAKPQSQKPMSRVDVARAVELLGQETRTERLTRTQAREFLRRRFSDRRITEANFRSIFSEVPTEAGRPKKADKEV